MWHHWDEMLLGDHVQEGYGSNVGKHHAEGRQQETLTMVLHSNHTGHRKCI